MKTIWNFFSSLWLTLALAVLICLTAAWGSLIAIKAPEFYRSLDQAVLFPSLIAGSGNALRLTLWIWALIALVSVFTVNTAVCTIDRIYSIIKLKKPVQTFYPQIVHIGFLIALLGHLAGSVWGFKTYGNILVQGAAVPVPYAEGLMVRLENIDIKPGPSGDLESLKTKITLLQEDKEVLTDDIEINGPVIYKGIAFYHMDQGEMPSGLTLGVGGESFSVKFDSSINTPEGSFKLGRIFPDFALDENGEPHTRSRDYRNPHIEILSEDGSNGYLDLNSPGSAVNVGASEIRFEDFVYAAYAVVMINKDPGIWLIIIGSAVLVVGMVLLLFFRGERGELLRKRPQAEDTNKNEEEKTIQPEVTGSGK